jgi:hypothetical protein
MDGPPNVDRRLSNATDGIAGQKRMSALVIKMGKSNQRY